LAEKISQQGAVSGVIELRGDEGVIVVLE